MTFSDSSLNTHCPWILYLNFWGVKTKIHLGLEADKWHFRYYFQSFETECFNDPAVDIWFMPNEECLPILQGGTFEVWLAAEGENATFHSFFPSQNLNPTFLPPFIFEPLRSNVKTYHASALCPPTRPDQALVIYGDSKSGKSTLLLMLLKKNWWFVTDDTVVAGYDGRIFPYPRPIGIREKSPFYDEFVLLAGSSGIKFETDTGITLALHPSELTKRVTISPPKWKWTVVLNQSSNFAITRRSDTILLIDLQISLHRDRAEKAILDFLDSTFYTGI